MISASGVGATGRGLRNALLARARVRAFYSGTIRYRAYTGITKGPYCRAARLYMRSFGHGSCGHGEGQYIVKGSFKWRVY